MGEGNEEGEEKTNEEREALKETGVHEGSESEIWVIYKNSNRENDELVTIQE